MLPIIRIMRRVGPTLWFSMLGLAVMAAGGFLTLSAVFAQDETAPSGPQTFFGSLDVQVVNIDVHVTDKSGDPITDLGLEDFELFEDGRPVSISDFFSIADGRIVREPQLESENGQDEDGTSPDPAPVRPAIEEPLPERQRLYLVIYVDNFNLHPLSRRWVINGAQRFLLNYVEPDDRVLVVSYDRDLKIRTPGFVSDRDVIAEALEKSTMVTAHAVNRDGDRNRVLQDIDRAENQLSALGEARAHAQFVRNEMGFGIDAIRDVVTQIAGIEGRKAMLYISDGLPRVAGEELFLAFAERFQLGAIPEVFQYDMSRRYRALTTQANAAGVTVYTLDARGLHAGESISAEVNYNNLLNARQLIDAANDQNLQTTLKEIATDTGGQAILNTNALGPSFRRINQDLRTYYSLGYQPLKTDGRYHRLEVKVKRPEVTVRHRAGYRAKPRDQRVQEASVAALNFGLEKNPFEAEIAFGRPRATDGELVVVPVEISIPIAKLTLIPSQGVHHGRLRVLVGIRDQRGDTSGVIPQETATLTIPASDLDQAKTQKFVYAFTLGVEPKPQQVAVTVIDDYGTEVAHLIEAIAPRPP